MPRAELSERVERDHHGPHSDGIRETITQLVKERLAKVSLTSYADPVTCRRADAKFVAGDHLRVWRPFWLVGYYHHGIYIDDARVVQFGGRIGDKHKATIGAVSLSTFENGGTAKLVPHGGRTL